MPDHIPAGTRLYVNSAGQVYPYTGVDLATSASVTGVYVGVMAHRGRIKLDFPSLDLKLSTNRPVHRTRWDLILEDAFADSDPVYVGSCKSSFKSSSK